MGEQGKTHPRMTMCGLGAMVAAILSLGLLASPSAAETYSVKLCAEGANADGIQMLTLVGTKQVDNNDLCTQRSNNGVAGIEQRVVGTTGAAFGGAQWNLVAPPGTVIKTLEGSRSSSFEWDPPGMSWLATDATGRRLDHVETSARSTEHVVYSVNSPVFTSSLQCTVSQFPGCPLQATRLGLHAWVGLASMTAILEDNFPPVTAFGSLPAEAFNTVDVPFATTDRGAGVEQVEVFVDGRMKEAITETNGGRCHRPFIFLVPCSPEVRGSYSLDTTTLKAPVDGPHVIRVVATDASGGTGEASETINVRNAPGNTGRPQLTGVGALGATLSATQGEWDGAPAQFSFQWLRCEPDVQSGSETGCTPIPEATQSSYLLAAGDVGKRDLVRVTARSAFGAASAVSDPSGPVAGPPPLGPQLTAASLSPRRFRRGVPRARGKRRGSFVHFYSSEAGTLRVSVARSRKGRTGRPVATFARKIRAGTNRIRFTGRAGHRALRPGRYQMTLTVRNSAGAESSPVHLVFKIIPG